MDSVTETFDRYADESESSSSDEFDSEIDTDKEGKGSGSSSTGKSSTGVKVKRSKKAIILSNVSENKSQQDADETQVTEQDHVLTDSEKSRDIESKESVSEEVTTSITYKGSVPSSGKNENKDSDQAEKSSAAAKQAVETDGDKLSEKADSKVQKEEEVGEAKDKTENKVKLDEVPKTEGKTPTTPPSTDVMKRPIPIIIVKPPPSPEEEVQGDWEPDNAFPSTR